MNSRQRRKANRKWQRENFEEIQRVIAWIKSPVTWVSSGQSLDGVIDAKPDTLVAFGMGWARTREQWRTYLLKHCVDLSEEKQSVSLVAVKGNNPLAESYSPIPTPSGDIEAGTEELLVSPSFLEFILRSLGTLSIQSPIPNRFARFREEGSNQKSIEHKP